MDKELTCLSQNVNSFNLSSLNKEDFSKSTFHLKLSSLFETKFDVILCQDTRLNNCYDKVISYANMNQFASYILSHIKRWSVCKKFHKCEFCENQGPSPGLRTRKGLEVYLPIVIRYLERG